jgi:hypothetical protein
MGANQNKKISVLGGQFVPDFSGQFEPDLGGQFNSDFGGQYDWFFQAHCQATRANAKPKLAKEPNLPLTVLFFD